MVGMGKRWVEKRMDRAVARSRAFQLPAPMAETRLAIRQRLVLVAVRVAVGA